MGDMAMSLENAQMVKRINEIRKARRRTETAQRLKVYEKHYYESKTKLKRRFERLEKIYGVTESQFKAILAYQDNKCGICRGDEPRRGWVIDHCHATGKIRGILCHTCNNLLGCARDNQETLHRAVHYLVHSGFRSD